MSRRNIMDTSDIVAISYTETYSYRYSYAKERPDRLLVQLITNKSAKRSSDVVEVRGSLEENLAQDIKCNRTVLKDSREIKKYLMMMELSK